MESNRVEIHDNATVLFADLVNYTELSRWLGPTKTLQVLQELYSIFDDITDKYGNFVYKLDVIGRSRSKAQPGRPSIHPFTCVLLPPFIQVIPIWRSRDSGTKRTRLPVAR